MPTTSDLRIRVSEEQRRRIKNISQQLGFLTISDYIRFVVLQDDLSLHSKINLILEKLNRVEVAKNGK